MYGVIYRHDYVCLYCQVLGVFIFPNYFRVDHAHWGGGGGGGMGSTSIKA